MAGLNESPQDAFRKRGESQPNFLSAGMKNFLNRNPLGDNNLLIQNGFWTVEVRRASQLLLMEGLGQTGQIEFNQESRL